MQNITRLKNKAFLALMALQALPLIAQELLPPGMQNLASGIYDIFTGDFMKFILIICLCGCAVAYGFNKDNEKIKRNAIAIAVAIAVLMGAQTLVEKVIEASQNN